MKGAHVNYRTQNTRLMRRLGFILDAEDPSRQILRSDVATYWQHPASGTRTIITMHETRYTDAQLVRIAISRAVYTAMRETTDEVDATMRRVRRAQEDRAGTFAQKQKAKP